MSGLREALIAGRERSMRRWSDSGHDAADLAALRDGRPVVVGARELMRATLFARLPCEHLGVDAGGCEQRFRLDVDDTLTPVVSYWEDQPLPRFRQ